MRISRLYSDSLYFHYLSIFTIFVVTSLGVVSYIADSWFLLFNLQTLTMDGNDKSLLRLMDGPA